MEEKIIEIVANTLNVSEEDITKRSDFLIDLGADSLDMVSICESCERNFDVHITDEEIMSLDNVGSLIKVVRSKIH